MVSKVLLYHVTGSISYVSADRTQVSVHLVKCSQLHEQASSLILITN